MGYTMIWTMFESVCILFFMPGGGTYQNISVTFSCRFMGMSVGKLLLSSCIKEA